MSMQFGSRTTTPSLGPSSAFGLPRVGSSPASAASPHVRFATDSPARQPFFTQPTASVRMSSLPQVYSPVSNPGDLPAFQPAPSKVVTTTRTLPPGIFPLAAERAGARVPKIPNFRVTASETKIPGFEDDDAASKPALPLFERLAKGHVYAIVGVLLLLLVCATPLCDAATLVNCSTYVYFLGRSIPFWTVMFCGGVVLFFLFSMLCMEACGRPEMKSSQTFMYMFTSTITLLGLGFLVISVPLQMNTQAAYNELMVTCETGPLTEPLSAYYNVLLNLRLKPDCMKLASVEQCDGFEESNPYTGFLKDLELTHECSGFCYNTSKPIPQTTPPPLTAVLAQQGALVGRKKRARFGQSQKRQKGLVALLSSVRNLSEPLPLWVQIPPGPGDTTENMVATGWEREYPPNLFTNANYKVTCDGAAARELQFTALASASFLLMEGSALLVAAVLLGFLAICSMSANGAEQKAVKKPADATADANDQYQPYPAKMII